MSANVASEIQTEVEHQTPVNAGIGTEDPMAAVKAASLPPIVAEFSDLYDQRVGDRDEFLWKWFHSLAPSFELSCVDSKETAEVRTAKTLLTIYVTVLDDLLECHGDQATFAEARLIPFDPARVDLERDGVDGEVLGYLADLWIELEGRLRDAPHYDEYADLFQYDLRQTINSVEYGEMMAGNPAAANRTGYFRYASHNMCMFPYADVDLMHSTGFHETDLGALRAILWDVQELARIGNDITTWEREIGEGDYSAGIVALAIEQGVIAPADLRGDVDAEAVVAAITDAGIEETFARQWVDQFQTTLDSAPETVTVDLRRLVVGMRTVFQYHLESRGQK